MNSLRKKVYVAAGYNTTFFGSGRKEFHPKKPMPPFEDYLSETFKGTADQLENHEFDEGDGCFLGPRHVEDHRLGLEAEQHAKLAVAPPPNRG